MFRRLTIRNFRSIEAATVDLGSFTVVVGPNGSGKSNFVDALVFLRDLAKDAESAVAARGGIDSVMMRNSGSPSLRMELLLAASTEALAKDQLHHRLVVRRGDSGAWRFREEHLEITVAGKPRVVVERAPNGGKVRGPKPGFFFELSPQASALAIARQHDLLPAKFKKPLLEVRRYRFDVIAMRRPQQASYGAVLLESGANVASVVRKLREQGELDGTIATMQRLVPGLSDLRAAAAGGFEVLEFVQARSDGSTTFSASDMSEGTLRALGVVLAAHQLKRGSLLIIEEPEANVHPGAAALIYDVLEAASKRGDVLVTTHSPDLLDAAKDETILVCSYADGVTRIGPLDRGQRDLVREGLFRLADLMRAEPLRIEGDEPETVDP